MYSKYPQRLICFVLTLGYVHLNTQRLRDVFFTDPLHPLPSVRQRLAYKPHDSTWNPRAVQSINTSLLSTWGKYFPVEKSYASLRGGRWWLHFHAIK